MKPSTLKVNRYYYRNRILPWLQGRPIADITATDVRRWFASLHQSPNPFERSRGPRAPKLSYVESVLMSAPSKSQQQ